MFTLILEINNISFKWYLVLGLGLLALDFFSDGLLSQLGLSRLAIIIFIVVSFILKIFYQVRQGFKVPSFKVPSVELTPAFNKLRQLSFYGLGLALILWTTFSYPPFKGMSNLFLQLAFPWYVAVIFVAALIFFIMVSVFSQEKEGRYSSQEIKAVYQEKQEFVKEGRLAQKFPLRRYAHQREFESIAGFIKSGEMVLDNGCCDGTLAVMLAKKGALVTACDISGPNIEQAKIYAGQEAVADKINFLVADAENLPFPDNSFDWVVSSHVLEHLPDFQKGLKEVYRITKKRAIIALPTCLNPCAMVLLGGDVFWTISKWSFFAWFIGLSRIILNLGGEGVNEGYGGYEELPHIWRYPWIMRRRLRQAGFRIIHFEASSLCLPYFNKLLPLIKKIDQYKDRLLIRNFGYGSIAVVEK